MRCLIYLAFSSMLVGVLGGCTETLPARTTTEHATTNAAQAEPVADDTQATADEPLPWPPEGGIPQPQEAAATGKLFEWRGEGRPLSRIVIDTDQQQARFYDGENLVGWSTVATGVSTHRTPTGEFEVLEKVANKRSNLYGRIYDSAGNLVKRNAKQGQDPIPPGGRFVGAKMPHFLRMTYDGIGIHAGPIPRPGSPASHGCIRMPASMADTLFAHVDLATQVSVVGSSGSDYGNYAERIRAREAEVRAQRAAAQARRQGADMLAVLDAEIEALSGEAAAPSAKPAQ